MRLLELAIQSSNLLRELLSLGLRGLVVRLDRCELTLEVLVRRARLVVRSGEVGDLRAEAFELGDVLGGESAVGRLELLAALLVASELLRASEKGKGQLERENCGRDTRNAPPSSSATSSRCP